MAKNNHFETEMGTVHFDYAPYCVGCDRYEPMARTTCKADKNGKVIWTPDNTTIREGVRVFCVHQYLCQHIAHELRQRVKNGTAKLGV